jgi:hypothetical protein
VCSPRTPTCSAAGNRQLDQLDLARNYAVRVASLRELIGVYDAQVKSLERDIHQHLKADRGYRAVQAINGIGPTIARGAGRPDR